MAGRLKVEGSLVVTGRGFVVHGQILDGVLKVGGTTLLPTSGGEPKARRIRGVEFLDRREENGAMHASIALVLEDISDQERVFLTEQLTPGVVLLVNDPEPGYELPPSPIRRDVSLRFLLPLLCLTATGLAAQSPVVQECQATPSDSLPPRLMAALAPVGGAGTHIDQGFRLCGDSTKWVVSVDLPARDVGVESGWRIAFLADSVGIMVLRDVSQGFADSHAPELRLFRSGVAYLLLAGLGDEGGSWGMATFDVGPIGLRDLGILDVGMTDDSEIGNDQSAVSIAQVVWRTTGWQVVFQQAVILRPNQESRQRLRPRNGTVTFGIGQSWLPQR